MFAPFHRLMAERMAVVISHRLSTVRTAERIVVLSKGRVIDKGTHEELRARADVHVELFEMQTAGYR